MERVRIEFPEPPLFSTDVSIRIGDINYGKHLGHDAVVSLLHEARVRFFAARGLQEAGVDGVGVILADLAVSYRSEAFYGETVRIDVAVGRRGRRGFDLFYRVLETETSRLVALAKTGLLFFDYEARKAVSMPEPFERALEA